MMSIETAEIDRLRGSYLSLAASVEYKMTSVIAYDLNLGSHERFQSWFLRTPIPFNAKLELFESLLRENTMIPENLYHRFREVQRVRNVLAHSFQGGLGRITSRGIRVPNELESEEKLAEWVKEATELDTWVEEILYSYDDQGTLPPISADDFANWPL